MIHEVDGPSLAYSVLALVMVAGSLASRRIPLGTAAKMAAAWVGIFGVVFALMAFRADFASIGKRLRAELIGAPVVEGESIRIPVGDDGHFWTKATINGQEARFLIDTGATSTILSASLAEAANVQPDGGHAIVDTANGSISVRLATANEVRVGTIVRPDLPVMINDRDSSNILGMNFLSSLSMWRVEGHDLILQP